MAGQRASQYRFAKHIASIATYLICKLSGRSRLSREMAHKVLQALPGATSAAVSTRNPQTLKLQITDTLVLASLQVILNQVRGRDAWRCTSV
jgi:hypothetical protein